jgi:hypothetical protein
MRKVLQKSLSLGLALIIFSAQTMAFTTVETEINSNIEIASVTNFDETEIYNAFADVNSLVSFLQVNDEVTLSELKTSHNELISNINSSAALALSATSDSPPIFSAFIWGCLLNWVGMLIVGVTTGFDSEQITKSAWGCLISSLLWGGGYFASGGYGCSTY